MTNDNNVYADKQQVFEEFSPKKFILLIRAGFAYVISKWLVILLIAILFGIAGILKSYFTKPTYVAELTFALDEGADLGSKNDYSQLSEQLGIETMYNAGGVFSSATNIVELMQSRLLIEKTLRRSVSIGSHSLLYIDFFLDSLDYRDKWMKGGPNHRISFQPSDIKGSDSLFENNIIRNAYETLLLKNLKIEKKGKGTSIISVGCVSENELFSKYFLEALIDEVTRYYIQTKTERSQLNVDFLQKRTDSIRNAFSGVLYGRATFTDANINPVRQITVVSGEKLSTDVQILKNSYTDLVRSLELAKTTLQRETPLIQYIDTPILPLKRNDSGIIKNFLVFFFIGGFLIIIILVIRKAISHIINS